MKRRMFSVTAHFTAREYLLLTGAARLAGISLASLVTNTATAYLRDNQGAWGRMERAAKEAVDG